MLKKASYWSKWLHFPDSFKWDNLLRLLRSAVLCILLLCCCLVLFCCFVLLLHCDVMCALCYVHFVVMLCAFCCYVMCILLLFGCVVMLCCFVMFLQRVVMLLRYAVMCILLLGHENKIKSEWFGTVQNTSNVIVYICKKEHFV